MSDYYVGPEGPLNATMAIVGEKGARYEAQTGRPFSGPSGRELNDLLSKAGISRSAVYITNVIKRYSTFDNPTKTEVRAALPALYSELSKLPNLRVIVPMGGVALSALSAYQLDSITSYRGSILPSVIGTKMVPTFHPAFYMRGEWRLKPIVKFDLDRALEESYDKQIKSTPRRYCIAQDRNDLDAIKRLLTGAEYISFDIELLRGRYIECIAFSSSPNIAYCIPITTGTRQPYWDTAGEVVAWRVIQYVLNQPTTTYVTQNGLFDCWHLWRHGIKTPYMAAGYDTMLMHRLRAPDLPHDLGFLTSIYTREPYYKDESGDWKSQIRTVSDQQFYIYNCKDAACTLEVCLELINDLAKHGMLDYYRSEIQAQWDVVTSMREKGMRVDVAALQTARSTISTQIAAAEQRLTAQLGWLPNTKSPLDMDKLYQQLSIPCARTPTGRPKIDIEQLYSQAYRHPIHRDVLYGIAHLNELRTLRSGFLGIALDEHGFYHPSLSISKTVTGRLASTGADEGGPQIQNIPKSLRNLFVPDNEQCEFTQADLAGAEAVCLAYYTGDPLLIESFEKNKKVHAVRGAIIYRGWNQPTLPPDDILRSIRKVCDKCAAAGEAECSHSEYFMAKKNGHAYAYLQGTRRAARELRRIGVFVDEAELERIKALVVTKHIADWQKNSELELRRSAWAELPLGRKREFYGQLDSDMVRALLSWKCQGLVGQITNRAMIKLHELFNTVCHKPTPPRIITQTHDSLLISHLKLQREVVRSLLQQVFHQPITINSRTFTIPIEITHGPNWRDMK